MDENVIKAIFEAADSLVSDTRKNAQARTQLAAIIYNYLNAEVAELKNPVEKQEESVLPPKSGKGV